MKKDKNKAGLNIVFLGEVGFPVGFASMQRLVLMGRGLVREDINVTVVCRKGVWERGKNSNFNTKGNYEGINYIYTTKDCYKPIGFFKRNYGKLFGIYHEFKTVKNLKKNGELDVVILFNRKIIHVLRYLLLGKIYGFPVIYNLVEMASAMKSGKGFVRALNNYILDKWVIKFFDGALPISDALIDYYRKVSPNKPFLKVPIICDFQKFEVAKKKVEPYFLYCGSIEYKSVIDFVVKAFNLMSLNRNINLYMIVSGGSREATDNLQSEINGILKNGESKLFSNIPYSDLVDLYVNAKALLIPLRPTLQDTSRFPHKIGEYLASANPVLTTNLGEIKGYFKDGQTALLSNRYNENLFADKMKYVLDHPEVGKQIGLAGRELGIQEFDYKSHGIRIKEFICAEFIQSDFKKDNVL